MEPTQSQLERAYNLLTTHGPATAYDYMQRTGQLAEFPTSLVQVITAQYIARQQQMTTHE